MVRLAVFLLPPLVNHLLSHRTPRTKKESYLIIYIPIIFLTFAAEIIVEGFGCLQPHKKIAKTALFVLPPIGNGCHTTLKAQHPTSNDIIDHNRL